MDAMKKCNNMFGKGLETPDEKYKEISTNIHDNAVKQVDDIATLYDSVLKQGHEISILHDSVLNLKNRKVPLEKCKSTLIVYPLTSY
jgi:hypothetical protein